MSGLLAGLGGAAQAAGNFAGKQLDRFQDKQWQERKMEMIEKQKMRLQDRDLENRKEFEGIKQNNRIDNMKSEAGMKMGFDAYNREQKRKDPAYQYELNAAEAQAKTAGVEASIAQMKGDCIQGDKNACGLLQRYASANSEPAKVKKTFTDQRTGEVMKMYEDGTTEPVRTRSVEPGRGTPFKEGYQPRVEDNPVYGEVKGGREAGERDYLNAYNDYRMKLMNDPLLNDKEPMSYQDYVQMLKGQGPSIQTSDGAAQDDPLGIRDMMR